MRNNRNPDADINMIRAEKQKEIPDLRKVLECMHIAEYWAARYIELVKMQETGQRSGDIQG